MLAKMLKLSNNQRRFPPGASAGYREAEFLGIISSGDSRSSQEYNKMSGTGWRRQVCFRSSENGPEF